MKISLLTACMLFCLTCGTFSPKSVETRLLPVSENTTIIKRYVETGGLYGMNYELIIRGTGEVTFKNNCKRDKAAEPERWNIKRDDVSRLVQSLQTAGFFQLGDTYGDDAIDRSDTVISVNIDGQEKKVTQKIVSKNTPEEQTIKELEQLINKTAEMEPRIIKDCSAQGRFSNGSYIP